MNLFGHYPADAGYFCQLFNAGDQYTGQATKSRHQGFSPGCADAGETVEF